MLLEELHDCIQEMKEIKDLEQSFNDSQNQKNTDKIFRETVDVIYKVVMSIQKGYTELSFEISSRQKQELLIILGMCDKVLKSGRIQEDVVKEIQKRLESSKKIIIVEWNKKYREISSNKIGILTNVKGLVDNQDKITFAINQIRKGVSWNFNDDVLDSVQIGIGAIDEIIQNLGLIDEVKEFLGKVTAGSATIKDLTEVVLLWLKERGMLDKLAIVFR